MARPKLPKPDLPDPTPTPEERARFDEYHAEQAEERRQLMTHEATERDAAMRDLGRLDMAKASQSFFGNVTTSFLSKIKKNKDYQKYKGLKSGDGHQFSGTWDDFCIGYVGKSREIVDEDIRNLEAFGEQALDAMQHAGIGYRELRRFRRLPEDQRQALATVAETEDRDSVLELAAEYIDKERKAKEEMEARLIAQQREHRAELEAKDRVLADKNAKLDELTEQDARRSLRGIDELDREQAEALERATLDAMAAFTGWRAVAAQVLWQREEEAPTWLREAVTTNLERLTSYIGESWHELGPYLPALRPLRVLPVEPPPEAPED